MTAYEGNTICYLYLCPMTCINVQWAIFASVSATSDRPRFCRASAKWSQRCKQSRKWWIQVSQVRQKCRSSWCGRYCAPHFWHSNSPELSDGGQSEQNNYGPTSALHSVTNLQCPRAFDGKAARWWQIRWFVWCFNIVVWKTRLARACTQAQWSCLSLSPPPVLFCYHWRRSDSWTWLCATQLLFGLDASQFSPCNCSWLGVSTECLRNR